MTCICRYTSDIYRHISGSTVHSDARAQPKYFRIHFLDFCIHLMEDWIFFKLLDLSSDGDYLLGRISFRLAPVLDRIIFYS